ncbi:MAG: hypothetical protein COV91_04085 [Candidatus Taylorbacteria bacterium CG11_big_fil_rev_8_21_14_0_20_46_11]|uniref:MtN3 and saliva related transmembrane protein n=1 Tax=Candidatus Taylorbacteria bacterium CG11_big_fil_rev_8_21_14_0_20_46_11 TaxID=1975025 RepID=A0A2H0KDH5_9BACT|nr:MAG: hypothetical protein COV91_04085 [Candidatus Taylorbacteria bacterium CG11_big_fil_rev_8_21_14_0_20_46_11]
MQNVELLGFVAGLLVSISLLPQLIKSWRTKSTSDISISWGLINLSGQVLWIVYGAFIGSASLVVMSSITFLFSLSLVFLKMRYK